MTFFKHGNDIGDTQTKKHSRIDMIAKYRPNKVSLNQQRVSACISSKTSNGVRVPLSFATKSFWLPERYFQHFEAYNLMPGFCLHTVFQNHLRLILG